VRFVRKKKYGFANRKGQIVIPPVYDGAMNFESGVTKVCNGCQEKCAQADVLTRDSDNDPLTTATFSDDGPFRERKNLDATHHA